MKGPAIMVLFLRGDERRRAGLLCRQVNQPGKNTMTCRRQTEHSHPIMSTGDNTGAVAIESVPFLAERQPVYPKLLNFTSKNICMFRLIIFTSKVRIGATDVG